MNYITNRVAHLLLLIAALSGIEPEFRASETLVLSVEL